MIKKIVKSVLWAFIFILIAGILSAGYFGFRLHRNFQNVQQYSEIVEQELAAVGIAQYKDLALAIIYTETKGRHNDLMQSSESAHGEIGHVVTPQESVRLGIDFLAQAIEKSNQAGTDIWTAVQAYNFGLSYIDFVAKNGGTNTLELAKEYSRTVVAPSLGNTTGEMYRYLHPIAIVNNGGWLYLDGGNFFYAQIVEMNQRLFEIFK